MTSWLVFILLSDKVTAVITPCHVTSVHRQKYIINVCFYCARRHDRGCLPFWEPLPQQHSCNWRVAGSALPLTGGGVYACVCVHACVHVRVGACVCACACVCSKFCFLLSTISLVSKASSFPSPLQIFVCVTRREVLAAMLAAILHDVDHPGEEMQNNTRQPSKQHEWSLHLWNLCVVFC